MEYYINKKENRLPSEMLDLEALSSCKLNDFETFDKILFGENVQPDYRKFYLNDMVTLPYKYEYSVALPFYSPTTMVEFQINHYVMWGVIGMLKIDDKPTNFISYNSGFTMPEPDSKCWACEWSLRHEKEHFCQNCPIWFSKGTEEFMCEDDSCEARRGDDGVDLNGYHEWNGVNTEEDYEFYAIEIQMYPWHVSPYPNV